MPLVDRAISQIISHGPWLWLGWVAAAYLVGHYGGLVGVIIGRSVTAAMVVIIEFRLHVDLITQGGPQAPQGVEWSFIWSTAMHVILVNTILLPVNVLGWMSWRRRSRPRSPILETPLR